MLDYLYWRDLGTTKIKRVLNFMSYFGAKKNNFIKKINNYQTRCFSAFKDINKIKMSQKINQLLSFKPMSKLAFRTL